MSGFISVSGDSTGREVPSRQEVFNGSAICVAALHCIHSQGRYEVPMRGR